MSMNNIKRRVFNSMGYPGQKGKLGDEIYALNQALAETNQTLTATRQELTTEKGKVTQLQKDNAALTELMSFICEKKTVENTDGTETLPDSFHQPVQKFIFYGASAQDNLSGEILGAVNPTATLTDGEDETATHTITASGYCLHRIGIPFRDSLEVNSDGTGKHIKYVSNVLLASLDWAYDITGQFFYVEKPFDGPGSILCDGYESGSGNKSVGFFTILEKTYLRLTDSDYTDVATLKTALAYKQMYYTTGEAQTTNLTKAHVNAILNGAKTFKGSTDVEASNDNNLTQPFSITYVKNLMES